MQVSTPSQNGRAGKRSRSLSGGWQALKQADGWLEMTRPASAEPLDDLAAHADWAGPVKLMKRHGQVVERVEFFLGQEAAAEAVVDDEAAQALADLIADLEQFGVSLGGPNVVAGWSPPGVDVLVAWLSAAGYETAADKEQNIRLTLKRPGCDGQATIRRSDGRLRMVLPLGGWTDLDETSAQAMRLLARDVNGVGRLVRIAVFAEEARQRWEAQVDLSGLPVNTEDHPCRERLWKETVRLALKGLELALRRLGLELPLLAEPRHRDLAALLLKKW